MLAFMLVSTKAVRCVDWGWVRWGGGGSDVGDNNRIAF